MADKVWIAAAPRMVLRRLRRGHPRLALSGLALAALAATGLTGCHGVPHAEELASGLETPAGLTVDPNGVDLWYSERNNGQIHRLNVNTGQDTLVDTISNISMVTGEQGLFGLALHPNYPSSSFLFAYATRVVSGVAHNQVVRITISNGVGAGQQVIFDDPAAGSQHNGGRIKFGPDGNLYVAIGDHLIQSSAQDLSNANKGGKIHRITPTGAVPADNPVAGNTLWAFGFRNSFGFDWDPNGGRLWETDNGPTCNDEVNLVVKNGNFAWGPSGDSCEPGIWETSNEDGPTPRQRPKVLYNPSIGITGAAFCSSCELGSETEGRLLVGDFNNGHIRRLELDPGRTFVGRERLLYDHSGPVITVETRPGQPIYFSDFSHIYRLTLAG